MDINTLKKLAGIVKESLSPKVQAVAEQVYALAEERVAQASSEHQGHGFDRTAVMREVEEICNDIKTHIDFKLRNDKF